MNITESRFSLLQEVEAGSVLFLWSNAPKEEEKTKRLSIFYWNPLFLTRSMESIKKHWFPIERHLILFHHFVKRESLSLASYSHLRWWVVSYEIRKQKTCLEFRIESLNRIHSIAQHRDSIGCPATLKRTTRWCTAAWRIRRASAVIGDRLTDTPSGT